MYIKFVLLAITMIATGIQQAKADEMELFDILSPAEIAQELMNEVDDTSFFEAIPTASKPRVYVLVDKSQQRQWVYVDGSLYDSWAVSTGTEKRKCAPSRCYRAGTPTGEWTPYAMYAKYTSRLWNARMDRAIFITGGIALHATYGENISMLGRRASGGCVRQHPDNADRLFQLVKRYGMKNTRVRIQE
ncbi:MAG: L,D-transpeptidase [Oligoflexia bacterium]|nr:L,D-transpeptidase [Oligoflexia bacterium]